MRFAVLISGKGSNLQAIIDAVKKALIKAEIGLVVSDRPDAYGLQIAENAGIKTKIFDPNNYTNKQSVDRDMMIHLKEEQIDFVVLAGYMRILTPFFIKQYPRKILNIHPSLLPSFKGKTGIKDAFTYGVKVTGVTVHFVDEKIDNGPIILQEPVKFGWDETLESLEEKIHKAEHRVYPKVIAWFVDGKLKIRGRKVTFLNPEEGKE
jgi:phosphoribosylglycinamide formyltransferase-1